MKFTVEQSALADGVSWVSRSLSSRPIMTALLGIVISTEGNTIHLTGSDLETTSKSHFNADVKDAGEVLVPGRLLAEISRSLPNKPVTFTL
ncbi:MAG: DNA polymerase III subunit beta, partial [Actinobacteria bacterium]|nr:DNA polymerase III subunit beta [Actinomycetota bacterium]